MSALKDLTGQRFGRLVVVECAETETAFAYWLCRCDCGQEVVVSGNSLRRDAATRNGLSRSPEYSAVRHARRRCTSPLDSMWKYYGGRGIEYRLPAGLSDATALLIEAIGPRPDGMTLDRRDNDGHYEIGNLRWATHSEQQWNRRPPAK